MACIEFAQIDRLEILAVPEKAPYIPNLFYTDFRR